LEFTKEIANIWHMTTGWRITQKPGFFKALLALSPKEAHQVLEKVNLLAQEPTPGV
jgi:hypothetical protein